MEFNSKASPKIETKYFKIYADVAESAASSPLWELEGRGVETWTVEQNQDITKKSDVLGYIDMNRGIAQPTQSGVKLNLRKDSKLGEILFNAWYTGDMSKLDNIKILQKFEFVNGSTEGTTTCKARLQEGCLIAINSFTGEAGGYLGFDVDIHYSNQIKTGTMPIVDGASVTFTEDSAS